MRAGRPRTFDRDQALECAIMVFWEHGYDATSIAMLTEALNIGAPSLYAAFGNKRELFAEALDRYLHTYGAFTERALAEEPNARDAIERLLHEAASAYSSPDHPHGCLLISAVTNCSPQSADIAVKLRDIRAHGGLALEAKIAADTRSGELPATTDAHALATFYTAVIQGMSAQARDGASRTDLEEVAAAALRAWPDRATSRRRSMKNVPPS
jgi:AcrR family transcriptional regulator